MGIISNALHKLAFELAPQTSGQENHGIFEGKMYPREGRENIARLHEGSMIAVFRDGRRCRAMRTEKL
jgi:hypothetical protein